MQVEIKLDFTCWDRDQHSKGKNEGSVMFEYSHIKATVVPCDSISVHDTTLVWYQTMAVIPCKMYERADARR